MFCISGLDLVILARTGVSYRADKLVVIDTNAHERACTHGHTGTGNGNNRRPRLASVKNDVVASQIYWAFFFQLQLTLCWLLHTILDDLILAIFSPYIPVWNEWNWPFQIVILWYSDTKSDLRMNWKNNSFAAVTLLWIFTNHERQLFVEYSNI